MILLLSMSGGAWSLGVVDPTIDRKRSDRAVSGDARGVPVSILAGARATAEVVERAAWKKGRQRHQGDRYKIYPKVRYQQMITLLL